MKVFVTGGTGFIGSHVLKAFLAKNTTIIAHRRKHSSHPKITIDLPIQWLTKATAELTVSDFHGVDVILHLASHSVQYPFDTLENNIKYNVTEPLVLFTKAYEAGVRRYVVAGSCFEYGLAGERYEFIPTDAPLEPTNDYATSKAISFLTFRQFAIDKNISLNYHRIFHAYGEGQQEERLWPSLKRAALSGEDMKMTQGAQIRDFVPVELVANKFVESCEKLTRSNNHSISISNIGSGHAQSLREFAIYWWNHWNAQGNLLLGEMPYRDNEVMRFVPLIK